MSGERRCAPATERNREPIYAVLAPVLPYRGLVLEIASGTGEHAVHFAAELPGLTFQPTDPDERSRASIAAWIGHSGLKNILAPLELDAASPIWPVKSADAVICINMVHISPWGSSLGLMRGAAAILQKGAPLFLYGPYIQQGVETAASNLAFDADLRRRNPAWGLRDLANVAKIAGDAGFSAPVVTAMPANNLCLVFRRV